MADCPSSAELEEYLRDRLPAERDSLVLTHLESCCACQQVLESLTTDVIIVSKQLRAGAEQPGPLPRRLGQYTLLRELGQGAMGVVYLAEQANLKRPVAVKVIRHGVNATAEEVARFCAEAEAVAHLQHANIVQIHEVGSQEGVYYLALEYVNGGNLDRLLAGTPQEPQAAAQLTETLARAVHHAHERGILHRDLKPANILLQGKRSTDDTDCTDKKDLASASVESVKSVDPFVPKITDFGLAKRLEAGPSRTHTGLVLGTPSYMAPEQASGRHGDLTPAADVYGLGALLYQMLTGRAPFKGATALSTLEQVVSQEPLPPRKFQRQIPRDLETICLKCLEKEPPRRYGSAADLAEDLRRFLHGEPIRARPIRVLGRAWKWAKRRPVNAGLAAAVVLVAVLGMAGILWQWQGAVAARRVADRERDDARSERDNARRQLARANIAAAASALQLHNSPAAGRSLAATPDEYRKWEWHHFHSQLDNAAEVLAGHKGPILGVAFSPDGTRLVSASRDETLRIWHAATGREIAVVRGHRGVVQALAFSPHGRRLASGGDDRTVRLWDGRTGAPLAICSGHAGSVYALAFNRDGTRLVSGALADTAYRLWDADTGKLVRMLPGAAKNGTGLTVARHGGALTFTPDGSRVVICEREAVRVVDAASGKEALVLRAPGAPYYCLTLSRDGRRLVTGSDYPDNAVRLWDAASGELLSVMSGHTNRVHVVIFSPDGARVVSCSQDQTLRVWDTAGTRPVVVLRGHTGSVMQAAFNPDGTRLVSAAEDGTLRLWNLGNGEPLAVFRGHQDRIWACAFSPDGARLASASFDRAVRLWDVAQVERDGVFRAHDGYVYDVAFSPDGTYLASAAWDNSVRLCDPGSGRQTALLQGPGREPGRRSDKGPVVSDLAGLMLALAFRPDGAQLVTGSRSGTVQFWDVPKGRLRRTVTLAGAGVDSLAYSPDGKQVAAALGNTDPGQQTSGSVVLLDARSGAVVRTLTGHTDGVLAVRFRSDGRRLASGGFDRTLRVWDAVTGEVLAVLTGHGATVTAVAFSNDGRLLASASRDRTVRLWDAQSLQPLATLEHASLVHGVAFSPDGTRLAAACDDNTIRLWDVATRQEVAELRGHRAYVHAVAFGPDGTRLVSASGDFTVRVWDTLSPRERARNDLQRRRGD
jgi:WD40 repeat protein